MALNTAQINNLGVDINEKPLKRKGKSYKVYTDPYEKIKVEKGIYQGFIDFNLSGKFLKGFELKVKDNQFWLEAPEWTTDKHDITEKFREWYGKFEGLTKKNLQTLRKEVLQNLVKEWKDII